MASVETSDSVHTAPCNVQSNGTKWVLDPLCPAKSPLQLNIGGDFDGNGDVTSTFSSTMKLRTADKCFGKIHDSLNQEECIEEVNVSLNSE